MTTLQDQLTTARLSNNCKIDLTTHVEQVELQNSTLPKRPVTVADDGLPSAVVATTVVAKLKADGQQAGGKAAMERFAAEKSLQSEMRESVMASTQKSGGSNYQYSKSYEATYHDYPKSTNPFVESRSREKLSGKDEYFVRRYAGALTKSKIPYEPKTDDASVAATEAYKKTFRRVVGREPTEKELEEVDRLHFSFDEHGNVGVVQKPHSCYPHAHISSSKRVYEQCENQVYKPDVPPVRAARDRFPGPIPVWSSTKNLTTMVAGDMHEPGHQRAVSTRKVTLNTVTGSK